MKINRSIIAMSILLVFAFSILISQQTGYWRTESAKVPAKFQSGAFEGIFDPADIRGSYSFSDVSSAFDIPLEILGQAFDIPSEYDLSTFQNKNLESMYALDKPFEIGNGSVKLFVALYKGLPYDYAGSQDYLPKPAVEILLSEKKLNRDQIDYVNSHSIDLKSAQSASLEVQSSEQANSIGHEETEDTLTIKGKTMFQDLLDAGLTKGEIEAVLGMEMGHPLEEVRTYCQSKGLEFSSIKAKLQGIVDSR